MPDQSLDSAQTETKIQKVTAICFQNTTFYIYFFDLRKALAREVASQHLCNLQSITLKLPQTGPQATPQLALKSIC